MAIKNAKGGEIFVPKIPSYRILDLANAFDKKIKKKKNSRNQTRRKAT